MSVYNRTNSLSMRRKNTMAITAQTPCSSSKRVVETSVVNGISCSTPERNREAGSPCESDSESASPVPFLCTQDGSYGDTEVVWNYYTPSRVRRAPTTATDTTPLSHKAKLKHKSKIGQLQPKQRPLRETHKKTPVFQDLLQELNRNIQGIIEKSQKPTQIKDECGSEEDMFGSSPERSPGTRADAFPRSSSRCLRKNLLSSKFARPESDTALESDDSMNECLVRASQMVEERVFCAKRNGLDDACDTSTKKCKIEQDSMDTIFNNIKMDSPESFRKNVNTAITNDSFDNFMGNLNDSAIDRLTQLPIINESPRHKGASCKGNTNNFTNKNVKVETCDGPSFTSEANSSGWTIKDLIAMDTMPTGRSSFSRHSSMPESPSTCAPARPSTSGTALSRHSSMPGRGERPAGTSSDDSTPVRCTPDEIKKKHKQAREKLLAKRLLPFSNSQQTQEPKELAEISIRTAPKFQPKVPTRNGVGLQALEQKTADVSQRKTEKAIVQRPENVKENSNGLDLKSIIEKKRKEALIKLKLKRSQNNVP